MQYESVIGLEVHVQLATESKLFCGCPTTFGEPPNSQTCPVCLGLPGVLPVLNQRAFEWGIKVALAVDCRLAEVMKFDRKQYYYPDLPKNYQISQYDQPLARAGHLDVPIPPPALSAGGGLFGPPGRNAGGGVNRGSSWMVTSRARSAGMASRTADAGRFYLPTSSS